MIRVADFIANFISDVLKVKDVFMVSGGGIMYLTDALYQNEKINVICSHHEQTSSMALEAYSRGTENFGVGFFTSGPGTTNSVTGLVGAWQDSVPCLFISGQTKRNETIYNSNIKGLRQYGVQEVNITPIIESITKYAVLLNKPEDVKYELEKMVYIAKSGRQGPVWLDVPLDVQGALIEPSNLRSFSPTEIERIKTEPTNEELEQFEKLLRKSKRPVIIAGQGIRIAKALDIFKEFVEKFNIPVVTTFLGIDVLSSNHFLNIGRIGIKGTRAGNFAMQNSDLLICIGSSLPVGVIGYEYKLFAREARKVVIDIDRTAHLKKTINIDLYINAHAKDFLDSVKEYGVINFDESWVPTCIKWKKRYPVCLNEYANLKEKINIYYFVEKLSKILNDDDIIVSDAGSAYYAVAQGIKIKEKQRYITSGALATMGYMLPAAIGLSVATKKRVIGITGDGSFQLNIQELQTLVHYRLPVKLFVLNNEGYLSIRTTQEKFFEKRFIGEGPASGVSFPDIQKIANAYDIKFLRASKNDELVEIINMALEYDGPLICEIMTPIDQSIIPTVSSVKKEDGTMVSKPLEDMYPFLDREEFFSNMIVKPLNE
jgi:acetolactate synthase-1/2/3 large subunit